MMNEPTHEICMPVRFSLLKITHSDKSHALAGSKQCAVILKEKNKNVQIKIFGFYLLYNSW